MRLSEMAVRLGRPLVCAAFGHERWPFHATAPLMAFRTSCETDSPRVELELCRRCGRVYASLWGWRADYSQEVQTSAQAAASKQPEAA